jgi:hypothetical protein
VEFSRSSRIEQCLTVQKQDFCPSTVLDAGQFLTGLILKARLVVTKPQQQ